MVSKWSVVAWNRKENTVKLLFPISYCSAYLYVTQQRHWEKIIYFNTWKMWSSTKDIIKDLALLNDFSVPEDLEPYKVLYPNGRGSKVIVKQKESQKFIDWRTGEVINTDELFSNSDNLLKSVGRGHLFGVSLKTKYQLLEQLRMARPLGSGDEPIESYCRRTKEGENSTSTSESESEALNHSLASNFKSSFSDYKNVIPRVKARRTSSSGTNALITGLLSRQKGNFSIDSDCDCDSCSSSDATGCNKFKKCHLPENYYSSSIEKAEENDGTHNFYEVLQNRIPDMEDCQVKSMTRSSNAYDMKEDFPPPLNQNINPF